MAGGLIKKDAEEELGTHPDIAIRERFISVFEEMKRER